MSRRPIPNSVRFEVFKRDSFTCQYCGRKAPDVVLQCDHIQPVAGGGGNDPMNLATSCFECNSGKSDKALDETHILNRQRAEMETLNERRQQLEMLIQWRDELRSVVQDEAVVVANKVLEIFSAPPDTAWTEATIADVRKWVKRFGVEMVLDAAEASCSSYIAADSDGYATRESINRAMVMLPRVAMVLQRSKDNPALGRLYYIRGILRRRLSYYSDDKAMSLMQEAVAFGVDLDWLEDFTKRVRNWSEWRRALDDFINMRAGED